MNKRYFNMAAIAATGTGLALAIRLVARRQARMDFRDKVVVITGGSRGLGLVLAREFAREGAHLALLARQEPELERAQQDLQARGAQVMIIPCDVGDRYQVEQALDQVTSNYGRLDILINNAGIIQVGPVDHMTLEDFEDAMAVHFWGPLYATLRARTYMRRQGGGRIVNISSIGGRIAVPHLAPYVASKFALVGLSDALRSELYKEGIMITTVSPGLMRTGSPVNALFKGRQRLEYAWFSTFDALPFTSTSAEDAARQILGACRYADPELTITWQARLLYLANALFPDLTARLMRLFNRLLPREDPRWGDMVKTGWESQSRWSPSVLTILGDRAAARNNELSGHEPVQGPERLP